MLWWMLPTVLLVLLSVNVMPLGGRVVQRIDLGVADRGFARVAGPDIFRFTDRRSLGTLAFRELQASRASFFVENPQLLLGRGETVEVSVWFRSSVPVDSRVLVWAEGVNGYIPKVLYSRSNPSEVSWRSESVEWSVSELRVRGSKLQLFLEVPHLEVEDRPAFWFPVGWIEISLTVPGPLSGYGGWLTLALNALAGVVLSLLVVFLLKNLGLESESP